MGHVRLIATERRICTPIDAPPPRARRRRAGLGRLARGHHDLEHAPADLRRRWPGGAQEGPAGAQGDQHRAGAHGDVELRHGDARARDQVLPHEGRRAGQRRPRRPLDRPRRARARRGGRGEGGLADGPGGGGVARRRLQENHRGRVQRDGGHADERILQGAPRPVPEGSPSTRRGAPSAGPTRCGRRSGGTPSSSRRSRLRGSRS